MRMTDAEYNRKLEEADDKQTAIDKVEKIIIDELKLNRLVITNAMKLVITKLAELTIDEQTKGYRNERI